MAAMAARLGWPVIGGCLGALASPAGPSGPALAGFHSLAGFFLGAGFAAALVAFLERRLPNRADVASGALVRGLAPADMARRTLIVSNIKNGKLADFEGDDAAMMRTGFDG
jgi:hypothetical protein